MRNLGQSAAGADLAKWNINWTYKAGKVVLNESEYNLYIAKQNVPAGIDISDTDYWVVVITQYVPVPEPPETGTATLKSVDGVLQWVEDEE